MNIVNFREIFLQNSKNKYLQQFFFIKFETKTCVESFVMQGESGGEPPLGQVFYNGLPYEMVHGVFCDVG